MIKIIIIFYQNSIKRIKENFDINLIGKKFDLLIDKLYDSL